MASPSWQALGSGLPSSGLLPLEHVAAIRQVAGHLGGNAQSLPGLWGGGVGLGNILLPFSKQVVWRTDHGVVGDRNPATLSGSNYLPLVLDTQLRNGYWRARWAAVRNADMPPAIEVAGSCAVLFSVSGSLSGATDPAVLVSGGGSGRLILLLPNKCRSSSTTTPLE